MNGKLIYKRWLNTGQSKVFDVMAYDKYTYQSYTDLDVKNSPYLIHVKVKVIFNSNNHKLKNAHKLNHIFKSSSNEKDSEIFIGTIYFEDSEFLELGKEQEITIHFLSQNNINRFMNIGQKWFIYDENTQIGEGEIIDVKMPKND